MTPSHALHLVTDRDWRAQTDVRFVVAVLGIPREWIRRIVRVTHSDLAVTVHVADVLISRHAIVWHPETFVTLESTWFGGMPGTDIQRAIDAVDREEARDLDEHCTSLAPADSALYGRIRR